MARGRLAAGVVGLFTLVLLAIPAAALAYLRARKGARDEVAVTRQAVGLRPDMPASPYTVRLWSGRLWSGRLWSGRLWSGRLWSGIRRAVGWRQASPRQRFRLVLSVLCAMSFVAGLTLAVAGAGKPTSSTLGPRISPVQAATANRVRASAWMAQQVRPNVIVSCDPGMCRQLRTSGFPAARLMTLQSTARNPLGSGVVVATPAIRNQFGARLANVYAPLVIAGFGTGAERVDIRAVAPDGAAAFKSQLGSEHADRVSAGSQLVRNKNIRASSAARAALVAGQVDSRLSETLAVLAYEMPIRLVSFDDVPPGASSAVPFFGAEIGAASPAALSAILAFLRAQQPPYLPAVAVMTRAASGQSQVTVRFDALDVMAVGGS